MMHHHHHAYDAYIFLCSVDLPYHTIPAIPCPLPYHGFCYRRRNQWLRLALALPYNCTISYRLHRGETINPWEHTKQVKGVPVSVRSVQSVPVAVCVCVCVRVCARACVCLSVCGYAWVSVCVSVYVYMQVCAHARVSLHVCVCARAREGVWGLPGLDVGSVW